MWLLFETLVAVATLSETCAKLHFEKTLYNSAQRISIKVYNVYFTQPEKRTREFVSSGTVVPNLFLGKRIFKILMPHPCDI